MAASVTIRHAALVDPAIPGSFPILPILSPAHSSFREPHTRIQSPGPEAGSLYGLTRSSGSPGNQDSPEAEAEGASGNSPIGVY